MVDSKEIAATAEAVKGIVEAIPIYQDAVQPAAKEIGKALATVGKTINVALAPVGALVWGYERIGEYLMQRLSQKLASTPPDEIKTPPANVAGPAIEALRFTGDAENLRDLYATLLATAMDTSTTHYAHPAFVEIIKQLSPDEAKVLKVLAASINFPVIDISVAISSEKGERAGTRNQSMLDHEAKVERPELVPGYLDNLCRLGLTEIPAMTSIAEPEAYASLEADPNIKTFLEQVEAAGHQSRVVRRLIRLTDLGRLFVRACMQDHDISRSSAGAA